MLQFVWGSDINFFYLYLPKYSGLAQPISIEIGYKMQLYITGTFLARFECLLHIF